MLGHKFRIIPFPSIHQTSTKTRTETLYLWISALFFSLVPTKHPLKQGPRRKTEGPFIDNYLCTHQTSTKTRTETYLQMFLIGLYAWFAACK